MAVKPYTLGDYSNLSVEDRRYYIDLIYNSYTQSSNDFQSDDQNFILNFFFDMCQYLKMRYDQIYRDTKICIDIFDGYLIHNEPGHVIEVYYDYDGFNIAESYIGVIEWVLLSSLENMYLFIDEEKLNQYIKDYLTKELNDKIDSKNYFEEKIKTLNHKIDIISCYIDTNYKNE